MPTADRMTAAGRDAGIQHLGPADLPLLMPKPCPICDAKVHLTSVDEWLPHEDHVLRWLRRLYRWSQTP